MEGWQDTISTLGFPIFICCVLMWALWQIWGYIHKSMEQLVKTNALLVETNCSLIKSLDIKVDELRNDVKELNRR